MSDTLTPESAEPTQPPAELATETNAETNAETPTEATTETPAPAAVEPEPTFADFGVHPDIVADLAAAGIVHPFPIQSQTLPVALGRHDIIGQAKTGTGKTLGFGVPILQSVVSPKDAAFATLPDAGKPQALVVCPTRELAVQVSGDLERAGRTRGVRVLTVYGGRAYEPQIEALTKGVEVVVGTPGRLLDLAKQRHLDLSRVRTAVLDEADEMLDLGFLPDVEALLSQTPSSRQTMLFSATMPGAIVALARRYMTQPTHIRAMGDDQENAHTVAATTQFVYRAHAMDKVELLSRVLQAEGRGLTIIFTRTKRTAAKVADDLAERGFAAAAIHGDLGQGAREQALRAFRNGKVDVLVATDVAARGIDVENVTHVVNFQCPEDEKTYVHRIGRTGRAGHTGTAITLVDWDDLHRWALINKALSLGIPEPQETYSSSEHLYADLDIPQGTTGRLARSKRTRAGLEAEAIEDLGETGKSSGRRGGHGDGSREGRDARDGHRGRRDSQADPRRRSSERTGEQGEAAGAERRTGRSRNRRRTHGSRSVAEGAEASTASTDGASTAGMRADDAPASGQTTSTRGGHEQASGEDASQGDAHSRPRRRRSRGRGNGSAAAAAPQSEG